VSTAVAACACDSIGAPKEIRRCDEHHRYWLGDKRLDSVSHVIKTLIASDYSGVDPAVLETARVRGAAIDAYFCEYLQSGTVTVNAGERADVLERLERLISWWDESGLKATAVQQTVYSEADGIAGTFDLATEDMIIDLKCVSKLMPNYGLQLGAYLCMDKQTFPLRDAAILHVTKEKVRLVKYNAKKCRDQWKVAIAWYSMLKQLTPSASSGRGE